MSSVADGAAPRATRVIAPRATRVLRAGPAPRGRLGDILVGIVGLLLLISTAYFAVALPKVETPPVIYQVTFATSAGPIAGESHDFDSTTDAGRRYRRGRPRSAAGAESKVASSIRTELAKRFEQ